MGKAIDIRGHRFGRLVVIRPGRKDKQYQNGKLRSVCQLWVCVCDCGVEKEIRGSTLRNGASRSCGCLRSEQVAERNRQTATHGFTRSKTVRGKPKKNHYLYHIWRSMKQRCYSPTCHSYADYGGHGIRIYEPWKDDFKAFHSWIYKNLGGRPSKRYSLDRIDTDGHYEPGNIQWATPGMQAYNKRLKRKGFQGELVESRIAPF